MLGLTAPWGLLFQGSSGSEGCQVLFAVRTGLKDVLSPKPNEKTEESEQAKLRLTGLEKRRYGRESFLASLLSVFLSVDESAILEERAYLD